MNVKGRFVSDKKCNRVFVSL